MKEEVSLELPEENLDYDEENKPDVTEDEPTGDKAEVSIEETDRIEPTQTEDTESVTESKKELDQATSGKSVRVSIQKFTKGMVKCF